MITKTSSDIAKIKGALTLEAAIKRLAINEQNITGELKNTVETLNKLVGKLETGNTSDLLNKLTAVIKAVVEIQTNYANQKIEIAAIKNLTEGIRDAFNNGTMAKNFEELTNTVRENKEASWTFEIERDGKNLAKTIHATKLVN